MALFSFLGITWLTLAAAELPTPTPIPTSTVQDIRVVLFISAPKSLQKSIIERVAIPVGQDIELVPMNEFQTAAKKARLRHASSLKAAVALATPLHLTHVVTVSVVQEGGRGHGRGRHHRGGGGHVFLEVFIGRLRPIREILSAKRYNLPNGKMTGAMAQVIVNRIKTGVQVPPKLQRRAGDGAVAENHTDDEKPPPPKIGAAAQADKPHPKAVRDGDGDGDGDLDPLTADVMAEQAAENEAKQAEAAANANHVLHLHGSLALTAVQRNAYLTAGVSGQSPPCYCGSGTFANTFLGVHANLELFFREGIPGLGLMTELTAYWPHTDVQTDNAPRTITSFVTDFRLALAWRWHSSIGFELIPRVGWGLYDYPLSDGAFPGLSYSYPYLGLDLGWTFHNEAWRLHAAFDYLATLSPGEDALRLAQKTSANGLQLEAGVAWDLGPLDLGLSFIYTKRSLGFAGHTFLFTAQNFDNVTLSDQQMQLLLSVGTRFW